MTREERELVEANRLVAIAELDHEDDPCEETLLALRLATSLHNAAWDAVQ